MQLSGLASVAGGSNAGAAAKAERSESSWPQQNKLLAEPALDEEKAMSFRCYEICVLQNTHARAILNDAAFQWGRANEATDRQTQLRTGGRQGIVRHCSEDKVRVKFCLRAAPT